ncbi:electron carrier/ protein disulfide oxidoreductase [Anaeramoeba flamelloides]|uniref:Electron carrier/ protein disulfide oxidoreductase n=1 Tax=Anaeramoeba flamelloides TaxID=1746091 RepID=A0AAV7ZVZ0_9EUKA|nr:electron carrier/ protein disulfide oxidoreductase [Anaeramoeba flamelloides]
MTFRNKTFKPKDLSKIQGKHTLKKIHLEYKTKKIELEKLTNQKKKLTSSEHVLSLQAQFRSAKKKMVLKKKENKLAKEKLIKAQQRLDKSNKKNIEELEKLMDKETKQNLKHLRKKIATHKKKISEFESQEESANFDRKIQRSQNNLKQIISENNNKRNILVDKTEELEERKMKRKEIKKKKKIEGIDVDEENYQKLIYRSNEKEIQNTKQELKKLEFELKKLRKLEDTKSNLAQQERLYSFRLQLQEKRKEKKTLTLELEELRSLMTAPVTDNSDSDSVGFSALNSEDEQIQEKKTKEKKIINEEPKALVNGLSLKTEKKENIDKKNNLLVTNTNSKNEENNSNINPVKNDPINSKTQSKSSLNSSSKTDSSPNSNSDSDIILDLTNKPKKNTKKEIVKEDQKEIVKENQIEIVKENQREIVKENKKEPVKIEIKKQKLKKSKKKSGIEINSVELLLKLPIAVEYFRDFLSTNGNLEYLLFFLDIQKFKSSTNQPKTINYFATHLYNKYLDVGAIFKINLPKIQNEIKNKLSELKCTIKMFDHIQEIMIIYLEKNSFQLFKESQHYLELKEAFQTRVPIDVNTNKPKKVKIVRTDRNVDSLNDEFKFIPQARLPTIVIEELMEIMISLLNVHFSISSRQILLNDIKQSVPFYRFVAATTELQKINFSLLSTKTSLAFWLNLYNVLLLHSIIVNGLPKRRNELQVFFKETKYIVGGMEFSLYDILHGILRCNKDQKNNNPYFEANDPRNKLVLTNFEPKIHFGIISLVSEISIIQVYYQNKISQALEAVTKIQLNKSIKYKKNKLLLPKVFQEFFQDFGENSQKILEWLEKYLDEKKLRWLKNIDKNKIQYLQHSFLLPRFIIDTKTILEKKYKRKKN